MENTDLISRAKALKAIKDELTYQEKHATPGEDIDVGIICGLEMALQKVEGLQRDKIEGQLNMDTKEAKNENQI